RLEGRRGPELERLGGLHVVVAVDEYGRRVRAGAAPFADDDRVAGRALDGGLERGLAHAGGEPLGGALHVRLVLAARADAGDAEELEQLVAEAAEVRVDVLVGVAHFVCPLRVEVRRCAARPARRAAAPRSGFSARSAR